MARLFFAALALGALLVVGGPPSTAAPAANPVLYSFEDPALDAITSPALTRFESEAALRAYISDLKQLSKGRRGRWVGWRRNARSYAQAKPVLCPPDQICPQEGMEEVVVSASKAASPSITNNQTSGVDEGDIVKQIGPFLLILQDGRIFSVDTRGGLRLADRRDVYRDAGSDTWYDEMLVQGDRVLVTAYSYADSASEISVFRLDRATGRLTPDGVFLITSNDYYDADNYATRIVGDRLVIYTPYALEAFEGAEARPVVRRWQTEEERARKLARGDRLLDATDIYRPVQRTSAPTIHTISICPLGGRRAGGDLKCRATAFIGPQRAEMFVSPDDVFLWTSPGWSEVGWAQDCASPVRPTRRDVLPAAIFRLPVRGGEPTVLGASGAPFDQFSMDSQADGFRALVDWAPFRCDRDWDQPVEVAFLDAPHRLFGQRLQPVGDQRLSALPSPGQGAVENRFADRWLVYGGRSSWHSYAPSDSELPQTAKAVAVPVRRPGATVTFDLPHNIVRVERVGDDMVLNGYRDPSGLNVTLLKLGAVPRVASTAHLPRRFESEGRSHAFNSVIDAAGGGVVGVPTVRRDEDSGRWWWRSDASDVSFLTLGREGQLASAGEIVSREQDADPSYKCEVSCIDWYGNSRPIFTEGRIFALMGTAIVEARLEAGRIQEIGRLDLTRPIARD